MPDITLDNALKIYDIFSDLYERAKRARAEGRRIALAAGVTPEVLDASDARFARDYFPNPDGPTNPPSGVDPTVARYSVLTEAIAAAQATPGYGVVAHPDGSGYGLWPIGIGIGSGPAPTFVWP